MVKDFKYPLILCLLLVVVIGLNYYCFGNFLYDCGREFLVPDLINQGLIPIKEIFLTYFPLSYQINALLFKIFGSNLDVLRIAGTFSSLITAIFIYFCAREFLPPKKSFILTLITTFITMFNVSYLYNYVMGYSYAFIYGTAAFFVSTFFVLKFLKENKFLYPAFFTLGLCFAMKAEFVFLLIPSFALLIYKKTPFKKALLAFLCSLAPITASFLVLFIKGFNFNDLLNYFAFMHDFMHSDILKFYNNQVFMTKPVDWLKCNAMDFLIFSGLFLVSFLVLYLPAKLKKPLMYNVFAVILFVLLFIYALVLKTFSAGNLFSYLCITSFFILVFSIKKKNIPLAFLTFIQLFLATRFNFVYSGGYLAYTMPIALLCNIIFFTNTKSEIFNKILTTFLILVASLNVFYFTLSQKFNCIYEIKSEKGNIYVAEKGLDEVINNVILFLDEIEDDKTVLILPEGHMFNYLTNKKTNPLYYQLLPNHIETLGEDNIIKDLDKNRPDYIILTSTDYAIYGTPFFSVDFGLKISDFVYKNYEFIKIFSNKNTKYEFALFKLKNM